MGRSVALSFFLAWVAWAQSDGTAPDQNPRYFPVGTFAEKTTKGEIRDFSAHRYAEELRALREPSLSEIAAPEPVYRFTWLRSFDHPVAIRLTVHPNGTGTLVAKMGAGESGGNLGPLMVSSTREINAKDVRHALDLFSAMDFWRMETVEQDAETLDPDGLHVTIVHLDGAAWIFEAAVRGEYHVIDRWSPQGGPARELGLYLARTLGRLHIRSKTIY